MVRFAALAAIFLISVALATSVAGATDEPYSGGEVTETTLTTTVPSTVTTVDVSGGGLLPSTGFGATGLVLGAAVLVAVGVMIVWATKRARSE